MKIRLASPLIFDSIVDGTGLRTTIFTQGCQRNCPGCHNPATHDLLGGQEYELDEIKKQIAANEMQDGITLSGGEPFLQAAACAELAKFAHEQNLNVWCFTGFTIEQLQETGTQAQKDLLKHIDILVDGPFKIELRSVDLLFKGSKNQRTLKLKDGEVVEQIQ